MAAASRRSVNPDEIPLSEYLVIRTDALPEVFSNVMKVKGLLQSGQVSSVNEAVNIVGMSRSAFYKYRDVVHNYQNPLETEQITIVATLLLDSDALSSLLMSLTEYQGKLLNISQSLPRHGFVDLMLSVDLSNISIDQVQLRRQLSRIPGIRRLELWSREDDDN